MHSPKPAYSQPFYKLPHLMDAAGTPCHIKETHLFHQSKISTDYIALYVTGIRLPSFENIFPGLSKHLSRSQVQANLESILSTYVATIWALSPTCEILDDLPWNKDIEHLIGTSYEGLTVGPHTLREGICEAHANDCHTVNNGPWDTGLDAFKHYGEVVNALQWFPEAKLPDGFVQTLSNLEALVLYCKYTKTTQLECLPGDIHKLPLLGWLAVYDQNSLTALPESIGHSPSLRVFEVEKCFIEELPRSLGHCHTLHTLKASSLLLKQIPDELQSLKGLSILDLSFNPLLRLPKGFKNLKGLKTLKLSGLRWMPTDQLSLVSDLEHYMRWHKDNPQLSRVVGSEKTEELYTEAKRTHHAELREHKILASINAQFFYLAPRLGHDFEEWNENGGVPSEIFELESLEELTLSHQNIHFIPAFISRLEKLKELSLEYCMHLQSLPATMGALEDLKKVNLHGCPSLKTPPTEIVSRGTEAIMAYLRRLAGGFQENWRTKLMFVGLGGAGKTSLLRSLMSESHSTEVLTTEDITNGIDIKTWQVEAGNGKCISYSAWDFAGQTVYYNTHQFFLSNRAVYLLLWTTRLGFEHAGLEFWLSSIRCHAPKAPIFVIGTHCDQVPKAELPQAKLKRQYPQIRGFHFVSSITGQGVLELQDAIIEATLEEQYMGEQVPKVYLELEEHVEKLSWMSYTNVMEWEDMCRAATRLGIFDEKEIRRAVQFLHDMGTVQYFDNEYLRGHVVINPQWIVDVMASLISVKNTTIQDGRLDHDDLYSLWSGHVFEPLQEWVLKLTEAFDLTFPLPSEPVSIVPCLLPHAEPEFEWPDVEHNSQKSTTLMVYKFDYLPAGLFNRMQVRLFQFSDSEAIWKNGSLLRKNGHLALITQPSPNELQVKVQGPRPQNIVFLIHEVVESLVAEAFAGVTFDFEVPCPDCLLKNGLDNPSMFPYSLVQEAIGLHVPYLQCRKLFHTVSMSVLQALLPPDNKENFDASLAATMNSLEDLRSSMSMDVFVSYCPHNVSVEKSAQVHPAAVVEDLKKEGFKCWYRENMADVPVQKKIMALQDCKVFLAFMSSEYEKDEDCHSLFLYAVNTLGRPLVVVAVGSDLNWKQTNLGLAIGDEVYANMRHQSKYASELAKLKEFIRLRIAESTKDVQDTVHPEVFLSYCWSNSKDAMKSRAKSNALGWADPRDIKKQLQKRGINCWLDVEQTGKSGLYQDISRGIRHAEVLVACVSKEYAESKNCMMELRFGACTLNLPIILAVVGTGQEWQWGEIGMLENRSRAARLSFQTANPQGYDELASLIRERLPADFQSKKTQATPQQPDRPASVSSVTEASFQEEYELAQRKFLRHISILAENVDASGVPFPRLFVLDFRSSETQLQHSEAGHGRPGSSQGPDIAEKPTEEQRAPARRQMLRRSSSVSAEQEWKKEDFCVKFLCEHDQGWHCTDATFDIYSGQPQHVVWNNIERLATYLAHVYALLGHSGEKLACLVGDAGKAFQDFLQLHAQNTTIPLSMSHEMLRSQLVKQHKLSDLDLERCHLPTGQIRWLCKEHQKANRVTVLSSVSFTANRQPVVTDDDFLMKEYLMQYRAMRDVYRVRQGRQPESAGSTRSAGSASSSTPVESIGARCEAGSSDNEKQRKDLHKTGDSLNKVTSRPETPRKSGAKLGPDESAGQGPESEARPSSRSRPRSGKTTHRELAKRVSGSEIKLKVAGQLAGASTTWPGQPTSRACSIL